MKTTAKILVVEDEMSIQTIVRTYLESAGFAVTLVDNGPEALTQAQLLQPDLIVLDLNLPGMDGMEVAARLREESEVYILMLSARGEEADRVAGAARSVLDRRGVDAEDPDGAGGLLDQPAHDADEGRLAGPVGPEQGEELAFLDLETDARQRLEAARVGLAQTLDGEGGRRSRALRRRPMEWLDGRHLALWWAHSGARDSCSGSRGARLYPPPARAPGVSSARAGASV